MLNKMSEKNGRRKERRNNIKLIGKIINEKSGTNNKLMKKEEREISKK